MTTSTIKYNKKSNDVQSMHDLNDLNNTPVIHSNNSDNDYTPDTNSIASPSKSTMPALIPQSLSSQTNSLIH